MLIVASFIDESKKIQSQPFPIKVLHQPLVTIIPYVLRKFKSNTVERSNVLDIHQSHQVALQPDQLIVLFPLQIAQNWNSISQLLHIRVRGIVD